MRIVDIADDLAGLLGELVYSQTLEKFGGDKTLVYVGHPGRYKSPELKLAAALGYLDLANLASPIKDVLKEVSMNGLKVCQVELA